MKLANIIFVLLVFFPFYAKGKETAKLVKDKKTNILFYDLNKNGKMDIYENPTLDIESRVEDILSQMTLEEKVGQMLTSLGWHMYERVGDDVQLTKRLTEELDKYHIGSLWGFMRADPWTQRTLKTGLNPTLAPKAVNKLQRYVIENTRLGIPLFLAEECPHGHMAIGTTVFPTSIGQSSTWNLKLIEQMGRAIAKEARAQGAHIGYGPVLDLARDPRWSRVEETYGEDPFLVGKMGEALVRGFQGDDFNPGESLLSTLKHFASYGWTEGGHNGASAHVGMREMEEAILPPFREAINAGALSVMSSYNEIDGIPSTANYHLLTKVLKNRWGFQGFTISDLRSIGRLREHGVAASDYEAAVKAVNAGLDNDLGMNVYGDQLGEAVKKGDVSPAVLDQSVSRILRLKFRMGLFDNPFVDEKAAPEMVANSEHLELAREVARQSIVLLKNRNNILPLKKNCSKKIAVIGPNADNIYNMLGDYTAPQTTASVVTVLEGIKNKVDNEDVIYAKGCAIRDTSRIGIRDALNAAASADVVIMVMGGSSARDFSSEYEETGAAKVSANLISDMESGEGYDRATLNLMGLQLELIQEIKKLGKPIILVLIKGRPLLLEGIIQEVDAIIDAWYPGMQGGNALADVLFGDYNPGGRLSISIPRSVGQLPVYYNPKRTGNRNKYLEEVGVPRYCFGYGLSYTSFEYSDMEVTLNETTDDCTVNIRVKIVNAGQKSGNEVVQLYICDDVSSYTTPAKQLRAFERIHLEAGESQIVTFTLNKKSMMLYMQDDEWVVEPGSFSLMIGSSSQDIRLQHKIYVTQKYCLK
ncbi:glycoside hydrolase family 3 N-terminal domain-containing protein [Bacteroides sp.]|uniref:glycoside hydrolase family 3 N-terminal domain-containing protein n=1 Tax=Bacteroides sp. TaxID=29523 RepID=UPI003AB24626